MFKKQEEKEKFVKVPQVEIDGELYHETAEVSFGIKQLVENVEIAGEAKKKLTFVLVKYVIVRGKVAKETVLREEEGLSGKVTVKNQMDIEVRKELKRLQDEL